MAKKVCQSSFKTLNELEQIALDGHPSVRAQYKFVAERWKNRSGLLTTPYDAGPHYTGLADVGHGDFVAAVDGYVMPVINMDKLIQLRMMPTEIENITLGLIMSKMLPVERIEEFSGVPIGHFVQNWSNIFNQFGS